jgi:hypothetical protein
MKLFGKTYSDQDIEAAIYVMHEWADSRGIQQEDYLTLLDIALPTVTRIIADEQMELSDLSKLYTQEERLYMWIMYTLMAAYQIGKNDVRPDNTQVFEEFVSTFDLSSLNVDAEAED